MKISLYIYIYICIYIIYAYISYVIYIYIYIYQLQTFFINSNTEKLVDNKYITKRQQILNQLQLFKEFFYLITALYISESHLKQQLKLYLGSSSESKITNQKVPYVNLHASHQKIHTSKKSGDIVKKYQ